MLTIKNRKKIENKKSEIKQLNRIFAQLCDPIYI